MAVIRAKESLERSKKNGEAFKSQVGQARKNMTRKGEGGTLAEFYVADTLDNILIYKILHPLLQADVYYCGRG